MRCICSFPGCKSGTASDKRYNEVHGLKNKSMFKFPRKDKFPELRQIWEEVIGREAKDIEVLCELHFQPKDIKRNYETLLSNSVKHTMERGKATLSPTAIPDANLLNDENDEIKTIKLEVCDEITEDEPKLLDICSSSATLEDPKIYLEGDDEGQIVMLEIHKEEPFEEVQNESEFLDTCSSSSSLLNPKKEDDELMIHLDDPLEEVELKSEYSDAKNEILEETQPFCLEKLWRNMEKTKFPEGWFYMIVRNPEREFILLGHWHTNRPAEKEMIINSDGSVEVFLRKRSVIVPGIKTVSSIDNVMNSIQIVETLLMCDGPNVSQRHLNQCAGYVEQKQTFFKYGQVRCIFCKKLHVKNSKKQRQNLIKAAKEEKKLKTNKRMLKNEMAKNKRMRMKLNILKVKMAKLQRNAQAQRQMLLKNQFYLLPNHKKPPEQEK